MKRILKMLFCWHRYKITEWGMRFGTCGVYPKRFRCYKCGYSDRVLTGNMTPNGVRPVGLWAKILMGMLIFSVLVFMGAILSQYK